MPSTRRGPALSAANPAIIPACVEPVTVQTTIVSKRCRAPAPARGHLERPVGETQPAERVFGGAGRDRVRHAAGRLDLAIASSHERRMPMSNPGRVQPYVRAHDAARAGCCRPCR